MGFCPGRKKEGNLGSISSHSNCKLLQGKEGSDHPELFPALGVWMNPWEKVEGQREYKDPKPFRDEWAGISFFHATFRMGPGGWYSLKHWRLHDFIIS
jgi:hypothetical protein